MRKLCILLLILFQPVIGASPVAAQVPGGDAIAIGKTPVTGGTSGNCLVVSSGKVGQSASCGATSAYNTAAISAGTLAIDLSLGPVFNVSSNANITTLTITGATAGRAAAFELYLTGNGTGYTQSWGASVKWASGVTPTLTTTNGKVDRIAFETNDGGTTWYASLIGQNY